MLGTQLADRFREALGAAATPERDESIAFAIEYTRLLARIIPDPEVDAKAKSAMASSIDDGKGSKRRKNQLQCAIL